MTTMKEQFTIEQERKNHNTVQIDLANDAKALTRSP